MLSTLLKEREKEFEKRFADPAIKGEWNRTMSGYLEDGKKFHSESLHLLIQALRGEVVNEKRIYGEKVHMWLMDEKREFRLEDFDGSFEKQAIIGYNTALNDILSLLSQLQDNK